MEQETQAQAPVGLTLQDLRVLAGAVELGAQRGAFRAGEMEVVGATYSKLATFLKANEPAPAPEASQDAEVTDTAENPGE
jgi:hypothetical protein